MNIHHLPRLRRFLVLATLLPLTLLASCVGVTTTLTTVTTEPSGTVWDAAAIARFGSATPAGTAHYDSDSGTAVIWNVDASLDNYGGVQTPTMQLDFSKAVIFRMDVVSSYSQYIVKLAVEGESEYFYVLSDSGATGVISIDVVDAMLSDKYRTRNTQPDPGYANGWIYDGETRNCSFHILAKGPDGEKQTAELVVRNIAVYNDVTGIDGVTIVSDQIVGGTLSHHFEACRPYATFVTY